jgi:uncharacterized phage protein (TIGR02218 family)
MSTKELYRVTEANTVWTFTSSNEPETYNGETYTPRICGHDDISDKGQVTKSQLDVSFPLEDSFAQHVINSAVDAVIKLTIYSKDESGAYFTEFRGRFSTTSLDGEDQIKITFENVFSSNRQVGVRPLFQRSCRYGVYNGGCKLNINTFKAAGTVTAMSADGRTVTCTGANAQPDGYYTAGVIIFSDGTMRYISSHVGNTLTLIRSSDTLNSQFAASGPVAVFIAPGCTQQTDICGSRFGNVLNFGGFPYIPLKNPMSGNSIV